MPLLRLLPLMLLLLVAGCESRADRTLRASPDYRAGYDDGCNSAGTQGANRREDSMRRDEDAYRRNPAYHAGWSTGFNACRMFQPQANQPGGPDRGPIADPAMGSP